MRVIKCPRCDINFIREDEKYCSICKRELKGEMPKDDLPDMCIECGEHPAAPGEDLCVFCLNDRKLAEKELGASEDESAEITEDTVDVSDIAMDEITPIQAEDIPDTELEVIHKELGLDEEDGMGDGDGEEDEDSDESDI